MGTGGGGETRPALPETQARTAAQAEELHAAGEQALRQREYGTASALFEESLAISRQLGHQQGSPDVLEGVAAVAAAQGQPAHAARLFGAAEALREAIGSPLPPNELESGGISPAQGE